MRDTKRNNLWLCCLLLACGKTIACEPIIASTNDFIVSFLPEKHVQIDAALKSTDLNIKHIHLPIRRSLSMLQRKELAINTFRTPVAVAGIPDLIQLKPRVAQSEFWLVTASPNLCKLETPDYSDYPVVGIRGIRLYDSLYPSFKSHAATKNFMAAWKMLQVEHAYFSLWPKSVINQFKRGGESVYVCGDKPYAVFDFYSYIHKNYAWAIPEIERSYREVFEGEAE